MKTRRVVASARGDGTSFVASDGESMRSHDFLHIPGMGESLLWSTHCGDDVVDASDQALSQRRRIPKKGSTVFLVVQFPPDEVFGAPGFNPERAAAEQSLVAPDLADCFEPGSQGMHATPTVDYVVILDGEIWLDLGEGDLVHLEQGDTVVQNAARHAWRNLGSKPATLAVVMVGIG